MKYFNDKRAKNIAGFSIFFIAIALCSLSIGFDYSIVITKIPVIISRFQKLYFPPDFSEIAKQVHELLITIMIAISASAVGTILAFFSSLAISKKTARIEVLRIGMRFVATFTRNIPEGVWAIILLIVFWFGDFLAFIVLSLSSFAFLTRTFADSIDETNSDCIEALTATGASYWQIIFNAVVPEVLPSFLSWSLYSAENNIRSSTIVGMLAGGGIGYLISVYQHFRDFELLFVAVMLVVITIITFDQISSNIRRRILN